MHSLFSWIVWRRCAFLDSLKTKLVSSMDDLAPLAPGVSGDGGEPKLGQELLHNVGLMVGLAETEIQVRGFRISYFLCVCSVLSVCLWA